MKSEYTSKYPQIDRSRAIIKKIRNNYNEDFGVMASIMEDNMAGIREIEKILNDIMIKGNKALQMGAYTLSMLNGINSNQEITEIFSGLDDRNPAACMADAGMAVSKLNPFMIERIRHALYNSHELFSKKMMDMSLDELIEDY